MGAECKLNGTLIAFDFYEIFLPFVIFKQWTIIMHYNTLLFNCTNGHMFTHARSHTHKHTHTHTHTHTQKRNTNQMYIVQFRTHTTLIEFLILLGVSNISLLCKSSNLIESILHPSAYCTVSGKIFKSML